MKVRTRGKRIIHGQTRYDNVSSTDNDDDDDDDEGTLSRFLDVFTWIEDATEEDEEGVFSSSDILSSFCCFLTVAADILGSRRSFNGTDQITDYTSKLYLYVGLSVRGKQKSTTISSHTIFILLRADATANTKEENSR